MSDNSGSSGSQAGKIVGAVVAAAVLIGLLVWGSGQSQTAQAEVITGAERPSEATYESEAERLDYESARLGEYDRGTPVVFEAKVVSLVEDAALGEENAVVNVVKQQQAGAGTVKQEQVLLVFTSSRSLEEGESIEVMSRYLGAGEYETPLGNMKEVPAFQVDYLASNS